MRIFGCQGLFVLALSPICQLASQNVINQGDSLVFPASLSSGETTQSDAVYCGWVEGHGQHLKRAKVDRYSTGDSLRQRAFYSCFLQRAGVIRRKPHTESGLRGSRDYIYRPPQNISSGTRSRCSQNHRNLPLADLTHSSLPRSPRLRAYVAVSNSKTTDKELFL